MPDLTRKNFEDHKLWTWVMAQFDFAKKHRDAQVNVWRTAENYLYGNQWKDSRMPNYKSKVVINDVFEVIETKLPVITARAPKIEIMPIPSKINDSNLEIAKEYAEGLEWEFDDIWETTKMPRKNKELFRNMKGYGNGIIKSVKAEGEDRIINEIVDIFTVFPDPFSSSIRDCEETFFIHAPIVYTSYIKENYGVEVKSEGELDAYRSFQFAQQVKQNPTGDGAPSTPVSDTEYERVDQLETTSGIAPKIEGQAQLIEIWYADPDTKKYPKGRVTTIARNLKDMILYDAPREYKYIPFFGTKNYSESSSFWGRPEAEQIKTISKAVNMIISQVVDNIRLTGNPKYERLRAANIDKKQITSEPGTGVLSSILGGFRWIEIPRMPRFIIEVLNWLGTKKDDITGVQDSYRGKATGSKESGRHAEILRSQTAGRLEPDVEEQVDMIKELGDHWVYIIQNMWKDDKVHVTKKDQGYDIKPFTGVILNPGDGEDAAIKSTDMSFKVMLSVGSFLPHDKIAELEETTNVVNMAMQGTPPALLDVVIDASLNIRDKALLKKAIRQIPPPQEENGEDQLTPEEQAIMESDDEDAIAELILRKPELAKAVGVEKSV